jgi:hypothetical protein
LKQAWWKACMTRARYHSALLCVPIIGMLHRNENWEAELQKALV